MDFVAIDTGICGDRTTHELAATLKIRVAEAVGILTLFFAGMALHAESGDLSDTLDSQIEAWCKWHGKRGKLAPLLRAQLCDPQGVVRAWERWNGAMIRKAKSDRERKRAARAEGASRPRNVHGQSAPVPRSGAGTVPDLTVPNLTTTTTTPLSPTDAKVNTSDARGGWPAKVADAWTRTVGIIQPGRVGKDLAPFVRLYPDPAAAERAILAAVTIYDQTCTRRSQSPKWPDFVQRINGFVPQNQMPPVVAPDAPKEAA